MPSNADAPRFQADYVPRRLKEYSLTSGRPLRPVALTKPIEHELDALARPGTLSRAAALLISVQPRDGMTWSAVAADQAIHEHDPDREHVVLAARHPSETLELERLGVDRRMLLRLAQRHGLVPASRSRLRVMFEGRAKRAVECDAALARVESALADEPHRVDPLLAELVEAVSEFAAGKAVVVDGFAELDALTRTVLARYLLTGMRDAKGRQLWIVFESAPTAELGRALAMPDNAFSHRGTGRILRIFDLVALTPEERADVAASAKASDRADYRAVGAIVDVAQREPDAARRPDLVAFFDGMHGSGRDAGHVSAMDLLYLLGVTAVTRGQVHFPYSVLEATLSTHTRQSGRWELLRAIRPGSGLSRSEISGDLAELTTSFRRALDGTDATLVIDPFAALVLIDNRDRYELPDPALCHAFWALYWWDTKGGRDVEPFWLQKIAGHLVALTDAPDIVASLSDEVADRLELAHVAVIRECLRVALTVDLSILVASAAGLLASRNAPADGRRRLRGLAWQAFALQGDDATLGVVLQLAEPRPGPAESEVHPLDGVFVDSTALTRRNGVLPQTLAESLRGLDPAAESYARVRAAWLVFCWTDAAGSAPWEALVVASAAELRHAVDGASERLEQREDRRAADVATLSIGCWVAALAAQRGDLPLDVAVDILGVAYLLSADLGARGDNADTDGGRHDLVLEGLRVDLLVSAGAGAAVLCHGLGADAPQDLQALAEDAAGAQRQGRDDTVAAALERRLGLTDLMWRRLGFDQLRAFASIRRSHFSVLTGQHTSPQEQEWLLEDVDRDDNVALLAGAVYALAADRTVVRAQRLCHSAQRALQAGVGPALGTDLALLALLTAHSFRSLDVTPLVNALLTPHEGAGERTPLAQRLTDLPEDAISSMALGILNVARSVDDDLGAQLVGELKYRRDALSDGPDRNRTSDEIDVFDLEQRLAQDDSVVDSAQVVDAWKNRGNRMHYAWVLHLLLRRDRADRRAVAEGIALLGTLEHADASPPLDLATDILIALDGPEAEKLGTTERRTGTACAAQYLARWHPHWIHQFTSDHNVLILRLLTRFDRENRERYSVKLAAEEVWRQNEALSATLKPLQRRRQFFEIVWHYFRTLSWWGLPTDPDVSLGAITSRSTSEHIQLIATRDGLWPAPFAGQGPDSPLSGDFLAIGYALFREPELAGVDHDPARQWMNDAARVAIPDLLERFAGMPDLSPEIRSVLRHHRDALALPTFAVA